LNRFIGLVEAPSLVTPRFRHRVYLIALENKGYPSRFIVFGLNKNKMWVGMPRVEEIVRRNIEPSSKGPILNLIVKPSSPSEGLVIEGGELIFQTQEPEGRGRENAALVRFLSRSLNIPASKIDIVYGAREKHKRVLFLDIDEDRLVELISKLVMWPGEVS
jgi:uncharacterized protein YggU (UPF0235/DUF167 family)